MKKNWRYILASGVGALALVFGAGFVMFKTAEAVVDPFLEQRTGRAHLQDALGQPGPQDPGEHGYPMGAFQEALADALGISLEDLEEAFRAARQTAIDQAVAEGVLTQDQADALGSEGRTARLGQRGPFAGKAEFNGFLAGALGISLTELTNAQARATQVVLEQAIEDGKIDPEQAELIQAREAIQEYMVEAMSAAYEQAIQSALEEGVISQDLADRLLNEGWGFPGGLEIPRGFGGHGW